MNKEEKPKVLYKIIAYDSDFVKELPDKVRTLGGTIYYYYDFKKHRYLSQFVSDDFDIYDELKSKQDRIDKVIEWICTVQQNEDNKHLEPVISTDELDDLLEILKGNEKSL